MNRTAQETLRPYERHDEIIRIVHRIGEISVDELAQKLGVSRETIRRDLTSLDAVGRLKKFHGGARIRSNAQAGPTTEDPFSLRMVENMAAKRKIAATAASLLLPGDAVYIDTGTTTLVLAETLVESPALVIITNSCQIAAIVAANPNHKIFLVGGAYGADARETFGHFAVEQIGKFRAHHAFLTIGALDEFCVMDFDAQETEIAKAMIERAEQTTILADSSKVGKRGIFEVAPWGKIDRLVTDQPLPASLEVALRGENVEIILPE